MPSLGSWGYKGGGAVTAAVLLAACGVFTTSLDGYAPEGEERTEGDAQPGSGGTGGGAEDGNTGGRAQDGGDASTADAGSGPAGSGGGGSDGAGGIGGRAGHGGNEDAGGGAGHGGSVSDAGGTGGGKAGHGGSIVDAGGMGGETAEVGGGAGGPPIEEDCENGEDDNGDGLADCEDPGCAGITSCEADEGNGWSVPGYITEGLGVASPDCAEGFVKTELYAGLTYEPRPCSCRCGSPLGGTCMASASLYMDPSCSIQLWSVQLANSKCVTTSGSVGSVKIVASVETQRTCEAQVDESGLANRDWEKHVGVCAPVKKGKGCPAGLACVRTPPPGQRFGTCISQAGDLPCPVLYPVQIAAGGEGITDSRVCNATGCECLPAIDAKCGGTVTAFEDHSCHIGGSSYSADGSCRQGSDGTSSLLSDLSISGGSCEAIGMPVVAGSVDAAEPQTICCNLQPP